MDFLNAIVALTNFVLIPGAAYGAQLALGALGVTMIYGILRFSNFAHGDTMAFGTMVTVLVTWLFQSWASVLGRCRPRCWRCPLAFWPLRCCCWAPTRWSISSTANKKPRLWCW